MHEADQIPPLLVSKEERTVGFLLIIAVVVGVLAVLVSLTMVIKALPSAGEPIDTDRLAIALGVLFGTGFAIYFAVFGRWPGTVSSETIVDVRASPYAVWEAFALRDDYPGWKKIYTGIERLDESGEVYRLHYAEDSDCMRCSAPRNPDRSRWVSRVEVLEQRRFTLYRIRTFPRAVPASEDAVRGFLDSEDNTMLLDPLPGGGTRVTYRGIAVRPKMWMAFLMFLGRPGKQHLESLKAHVEDTPDESLFGIAAKRMERARNASVHCGCGDQASPRRGG